MSLCNFATLKTVYVFRYLSYISKMMDRLSGEIQKKKLKIDNIFYFSEEVIKSAIVKSDFALADLASQASQVTRLVYVCFVTFFTFLFVYRHLCFWVRQHSVETLQQSNSCEYSDQITDPHHVAPPWPDQLTVL